MQAAILLNFQLALRSNGGIVSSDAFIALLRERVDQPLSRLAQWIARREIVSVEIYSHHWIPMFQFVPGSLALHPGVGLVLNELTPINTDREVAEWFVKPNLSLDGALPAVLVASRPADVLQAAQVERLLPLQGPQRNPRHVAQVG